MVNFLFRQLMSRQLGEMEYTQEEALVPAAPYLSAKIRIAKSTCSMQAIRATIAPPVYEARYIAAHINRLLREGLTVQDGGKARPARRKDFCILLRGVKAGRIPMCRSLRAAACPHGRSFPADFLILQKFAQCSLCCVF